MREKHSKSFFLTGDSTKSKECNTENGPQCIFPFRFLGNLHYTCQPYSDAGIYWCATAVRNNSQFVEGPNTWGLCGPDCPTPIPQSPFKLPLSNDNTILKDVIEFQHKDEAWQCKFSFIKYTF